MRNCGKFMLLVLVNVLRRAGSSLNTRNKVERKIEIFTEISYNNNICPF